MGKPRLIILVRHGHSEGNKNRAIHQTVPDHRVRLTQEGWRQAREAGKKLRNLLRPDDTLHFFTSPYRRTRETTEGILQSLSSEEPDPSPFPRDSIKVYEEPRLREQDFGNFQPCTEEMARMWRERARYGHFFYRIPNGESAADAYDRVSGFNESLWRLFGDEDFASVCVLVTHGLMSRIFLMKWYHFSVEYFEDLRNVNHCEFIVMKLNPATGKYVLQNKLRTWSGLGKEQERRRNNPEEADDDIIEDSAVTPWKMWCGCHPNDCEHIYRSWHAAPKRRNTPELFEDDDLPDTVRDLSIKQGGRGTGTITHNGCLVETAGTKGSSEQQPAQRKPEGGQEHDDTGDGRTGATTAADQEGPLVPSGSLDLSPMLPSFKISDMPGDDESPSTTPRQSQNQGGGAAAAERKESRQEGDMSREEPPEADPAAGMHPPVHACQLPQHQEPPPLASPLPHRARRADLEEKIWRLGRDGGGSDSGVSSMEPSTTSSSEVSDRVEGCTHTDDEREGGCGSGRGGGRGRGRLQSGAPHPSRQTEVEDDPHAFEKSIQGSVY